ncbi:hypothetical protein [Candidatus Enterococcus murrayae]|uniref:Tandem five-TM protein n=1 Tax=Candidatus Enterococcus murrayae TaxID=2815321 RepID=A0ABS3HBW5_9ENTE|nr:hypothetical protein [Enterococcus sp. MJM16]MBO0450956.1 hypothetical protein [Enterococcus sp. MJM16]
MEKNKNQQIYICKTDDNKIIYFNKATSSFGSVYYSEKKVSQGVLLTTNLLSYAFIRQFDFLVMNNEYEIFGVLLTVLLGVTYGVLAGVLKRNQVSKREIVVKRMRIDQKKLDNYLALANVELDQNKGVVFFLFFGTLLCIIAFHISGSIYLLLGGMILMSMGVFYLIDYNLKVRKKLYAELKEMKIK